MFSLVIVVISIVLVALLASAAFYYGGSSFGLYSDEAKITQYTNELSQIKGAVAAYKAEYDESPATVQDLIDRKYLKGEIKSGWVLSERFAVSNGVDGVPDSLCLKFNKKQGVDLIPSCADRAYADMFVCCTPVPTQ